MSNQGNAPTIDSHPRRDWLKRLAPGVPFADLARVAPLPDDAPEREENQDALWHDMELLAAVVLEPEIKTLLDHVGIPHGAHVLDLGCGVGAKSLFLLDAGADHVTGIDIDPDAIAYAESLAQGDPRLTFRQGDALRGLPFTDDSFDAVYVGCPFVSFFDVSVLDDLRRVTKNGGKIIFETVNLLPHLLYGPDYALQSRVTAARWAHISTGDVDSSYAAGFHWTRLHLGLSLESFPVTRVQPFDPVLTHYLRQMFAVYDAPWLNAALSVDDWNHLLDLYTSGGPDRLFASPLATIHMTLAALTDAVDE